MSHRPMTNTSSLKIAAAYWPGPILKFHGSPGIDPKESIPPAYVAWRVGTSTLFLLGS
jgi:hypothetical protein